MYTFGAEILPYHDFPLDLALGELAKLGFRHVNLWSSAPPLAAHVNPGDDVAAIRSALARHGISPTALTVYGKSQAEIAERIELAAQLGINTIVFDCEANYPDFVGRFLPPLVELAARNGVRIAVENHLTVPFTEDFESGGHEHERWHEGVDSFDQIRRLVTDLDDPHLGVCLAPPHLWVMAETISTVAAFLMERKKLFFYYIWDIDRNYRRGVDGLNFGPGDRQLPRPDGVLDHRVLLHDLARLGYEGVASLKCHGTAGWSLEKVTNELERSAAYIRRCLPHQVASPSSPQREEAATASPASMA
jgi:sugar phosphate isomerase/epimerase